MSRTIKLTKGKEAIVDDEDYDFLSQWKWCYHNGYAKRNKEKIDGKRMGHIFMHRLINKTPDGFDTDHINRNKLDNRKENLRTVTRGQNEINKNIRKDNTSGVKGVVWNKNMGRWMVRVWVDNKSIFLGYFKNLNDASKARLRGENKYYAG